MLIASLDFLAAEFEQRVMAPVAGLKSTPVAALALLVDLYLDPEIASPRKVSVWYAFWGEASSRQEYYDICGRQDDSSAALVRELIEALIRATSASHLDADGIALGLIGVLEILWQDIAFQTERDIDRAQARRRAMAFLESIFPGCFAPTPRLTPAPDPQRAPLPVASGPGRTESHSEALFHGDWIIAGHESQIPGSGDSLAAAIGTRRVMVVRGAAGSVRALCEGETLDLLSVGGLLLVKRPGVVP
jgi:TetR/AcrR family transcriptional repressor of bet genes